MSSNIADAHLEIEPDTELTFTLSGSEPTPKCIMTLRHPDPTSPPIAFKVKTTQPRRYLVRPNQGLIQPGQMQEVQILLVEKEKQNLMHSYQRLGQTALDNSKDKFLVQSVAIDQSKAAQLTEYDQLTTMWASVSSSGVGVANRKLHVRHTVVSDGSTGGGMGGSGDSAFSTQTQSGNSQPPESMTQEQLVAELTILRRKYDELVAFSVNLTAERDILNNTLEQTKRDLNREVAKSSSSSDVRGRHGPAAVTTSSSSISTLKMLLVAVFFMLLGVQMEKLSLTGFLQYVPILGQYFTAAGMAAAPEMDAIPADSVALNDGPDFQSTKEL